MKNTLSLSNSNFTAKRRGGFVGRMVGWFIRVVIYDICITTIQQVLGVSRFTALFIFLGIVGAIAFGGYMMRRRSSASLEM